MPFELTGNKVSLTYHRLLQIDSSSLPPVVYDGAGNVIPELNVTASYALNAPGTATPTWVSQSGYATTSLSSSWADACGNASNWANAPVTYSYAYSASQAISASYALNAPVIIQTWVSQSGFATSALTASWASRSSTASFWDGAPATYSYAYSASCAINSQYAADATTAGSANTAGTADSANAVYYTEYSNGGCAGGTTIDWRLGHRQSMTLNGNVVLSFVNPAQACNTLLRCIQNGKYGISFPANCLFAEGVRPTMTPAAGAIDLLSFYFDGSQYYCMFGGNFH
jgi:hypothetical protein